jgi:predicted metal-dependent hydrolase
MSVQKHQMIVNDLAVEVQRKKIKHLHLAVYPPDGRVRVSVPIHVDDETVRQVVISKLPWIRRQQSRLEGLEMHTRREYVSGEGHYFQGRRYLLEVIVHDAPEKVILRGDTHIELYVRPGSDAVQRERVLLGWYRQQLKRAIPALIDQWEAIVGVEIAEWRIKQMRTRWGSCNVKKRRIWLNLELAKRSTQCLEYIIVHELVHLLERRHNVISS